MVATRKILDQKVFDRQILFGYFTFIALENIA
jgi:hypothetical protein